MPWVERIGPDAVGCWEIHTTFSGAYELDISADAGASLRLVYDPDDGSDPALESGRSVLAWGSYDLLGGIRPGLKLGDQLLVVFHEERPNGLRLSLLTTMVTHIVGA